MTLQQAERLSLCGCALCVLQGGQARERVQKEKVTRSNQTEPKQREKGEKKEKGFVVVVLLLLLLLSFLGQKTSSL